MAKTLFVAHLTATLFMTGVIWFVQIVHYPLFRLVGNSEFARYETAHTFWTTWVVAPPMLTEMATAVLLLLFKPKGVSDSILWVNLALLAAIWLSTAFLQVPCHQQLSQGFDAAAHHRLVVTNWLRTVCWTVRSGLLLWLTAKLMVV
ncbi:hypothetical protein Q2T83_17685 [Fervidibacter sacchari]|uniref:DUF1772 domain-containing protein n=1 Tax=Candidatus Fervidibacter sacchari TaxID=1448929 RepID=A0ABT2EKX0_9BACT|nr:hypothetical protein [Candidatus Fervidibacter sacchari]MCS3918354.1 hypothetical protein [Candidatus Fervidibacter sacchari]WKU16145.1 hypothetical protein Q2T83_17685 [Candidatus Fervidibacter sacchari]